MVERCRLWFLLLGAPFTLPNDLQQIIQPVGHSFIKYRMEINNFRSKKTL